jgi:5'-methylthioadenosine phosphorylase
LQAKAEIGVFGGSGLYSLLENVEEVKVETPFGAPSDKIAIAKLYGKNVAFLPRHGKEHHLPPHKIPYKANLWAMKSLGVRKIIGPCAAGSLKPDVKPGEFVICDQFVDRTWGREDTFYDGPITTHVSAADPYCPSLRQIAIETCERLSIPFKRKGTVVVIQGPRFSTRSESKWFSSQGWEVINMTQYPECILARELEICYVNISLITDYDVGAEGVPPVSHEEVIRVFSQNNEKVKKLIFGMIEKMDPSSDCTCHHVLKEARFN